MRSKESVQGNVEEVAGDGVLGRKRFASMLMKISVKRIQEICEKFK